MLGRLCFITVFVLFLALALTGCQQAGPTPPVAAPSTGGQVDTLGDLPRDIEGVQFPPHCGNAMYKALYGYGWVHTGWVAVWNDANNLYIHYRTKDLWYLDQTHLAVVTYLLDIPHDSQYHPIVDNFPYQQLHDPAVQDFRYTIPLTNLPPGQLVYIAAQADVHQTDVRGEIIRWEDAWGDGCCKEYLEFWAMFFTYTIQACN